MKYILTFLLIFLSGLLFSQSIRINEFSQGANGSKEWVELIVTAGNVPVGPVNCKNMKFNISGWILDDNNGDFSPPNHYTGTGVATGYLRFKNEAPWNSLPVGAIIVIYNAADKDIVANFPADDVFDYSNDCVYVVPSNHSSLEYCTNAPSAQSCTVRLDYANCTTFGVGSWVNIGLANAGDAIQLRDPSFNLVHGLVYGKSTNVSGCTLITDMIGNALAPLITNSAMSGTSAAFNGLTNNDFFNVNSWVIQNYSLATPGRFNNPNDSIYITDKVRGGCTCLYILPEGIKLNGNRQSNNTVKLYWDLKNETNFFVIEKQTDKLKWHNIVTLRDVTEFIDDNPSTINYYRLRFNDRTYSNTISIKTLANTNAPVRYFNLLGQEIFDINLLPPNSIYIKIENGKTTKMFR